MWEKLTEAKGLSPGCLVYYWRHPSCSSYLILYCDALSCGSWARSSASGEKMDISGLRWVRRLSIQTRLEGTGRTGDTGLWPLRRCTLQY